MVAAAVGSLYNAQNVVVGEAVGYIAPAYTPMAPDSSVLFDSTNWVGKTLTVTGIPTGGNIAVTIGNQTATILFNSTLAQAQTALAALSNIGTTNGVSNVTVTGGPFPATPMVITLKGLAMFYPISVAPALSGGTTPTAVLSGGLWTPGGGTDQGWKITFNKSTNKISIEEQSPPVAMGISSQEVMIDAVLAEDVSQVIQWAFNTTKAVTAVGTGQPGKDRHTLSDALAHCAVALETTNTFGLARRYYIPDTTQATNSATAFRRAAAARTYPVSFGSVCPASSIVIDELWAPGN